MVALYRILMRLYPAEYFHEYVDEMAHVFSQAQDAASGQNVWRRAVFWIRELFGVLVGAFLARCRNFHWTPFRRFEMRSEFRFSRVTIAVMTALLAFVILAIDQIRIISTYGDSAAGMNVGILHIPSLSRVFFL